MHSRKSITTYALYRHRYPIGYALLSILLIGVLAFVGLFTPGGLRAEEMLQITHSGSLDFSQWQTMSPVDLPYRLFQFGVFSFFGVSVLSAKLTSLILGLLLVVSFFFLLKKWTSRAIAMVVTAIFSTTQIFLFAAQDATPLIVPLFWLTLILLAATQIATKAHGAIFWKISFFSLVAISLYSPLSVYLLPLLLLVNVAHPHMRFIGKRLGKKALLSGFFISLMLLAPLGFALYKDYHHVFALIGMPDSLSSHTIVANGKHLAEIFFSNIANIISAVNPVLSFAVIALAVLGVFRAIKKAHTTRSYVLFGLIIIYSSLVLLQPAYYSLILLPIMLAVALGFEEILGVWYGLFPKNPYARITALLPLSLLVSSIVLINILSFSTNYHYNPVAMAKFSTDVSIINKEAAKRSMPMRLVVAESELPFYKTVARFNTNIEVSTSEGTSTSFYFTHDRAVQEKNLNNLTVILTNDRTENADRLYFYEKR